MRLMKTKKEGNAHVSPCSKAELIEGISKELKDKKHHYPSLDRCTRSHLIDIAAEINILIDYVFS